MNNHIKKLLFVSLVLSLCSFELLTAQSIKEPEFNGQVLAIVEDQVIALEVQKPFAKTKNGGMVLVTGALAKVKTILRVEGESSNVVIPHQDSTAYQFIVKVPNNEDDPSQVITLIELKQKVKMNKKNSYRFVETGSANGFKAESGIKSFKTFDASKYGESSFLIESSELKAGKEYAIVVEGYENFNLFRIK